MSTSTDPQKPEARTATGAVRDFLDDLTPAHVFIHDTEAGHVWEWSTPEGMWKITYAPNFMGTIFGVGRATVTVTGPDMDLTVVADDTGLGILGANLRILGVVPAEEKACDPVPCPPFTESFLRVPDDEMGQQ